LFLFFCHFVWNLAVTRKEERGFRLFENGMLRRIFGHKDYVTGRSGKLHNEECRDAFSSQNILTVMKLKRMRRTEHIRLMGSACGFMLKQ
jgi:hypothetical protein